MSGPLGDSPPIFVITGQLASGKSSLARALLDRFPRGLHIDVDAVREMVTSGLASPLEWTDETTRQFELAVSAAAAVARIYRSAGFAVAIEGAIDPTSVELALSEAGLDGAWIGVELHPRVDVAIERNRSRRTKPFDTSILERVIHDIDRDIAAAAPRKNWTRLDNSEQSVADTTDQVLGLWTGRDVEGVVATRSAADSKASS